jgi:hypothetical protein
MSDPKPWFDPDFALPGPPVAAGRGAWVEPDGKRIPADSAPPRRDTEPCPPPESYPSCGLSDDQRRLGTRCRNVACRECQEFRCGQK